jgi:ketosteroid isomerase-like protein
MSEENVKALRAQVDALNRGDLDAWLEGFDPEVEFREPPEWPGGEVGRGREAALTTMRRAIEDAEDLNIEIEGIEELDTPDRLFLTTHVTARGKGSGIPIEFNRYDVIKMRDGKILDSEIYLNREEALEAAGLSE